MRKLVLVSGMVLMLVLGAFVVACGGDDTTDTTAAATTASTAAPTTASTAAPSTATTGAASTDTTGAATGEPIKIGHIVNLTGPQAMVGEMMEKAVQYAFDEIGNQIAGRPVEIIVVDGKDDPAATVDLAKMLVERDKVAAILGPTGTGQKLAMAEYIKTAGIPMILYNPTPLFAFEDNKWVVGSGGTVPQYPSVMAAYAYNVLGYRNVHTISQDNSAGRAFIDPFTDYFSKAGGKVLQQQWVPVPCPDFAPFLTTLPDADALVAWDAGSDAIGLFTQWHQLGIDKKMPILGTFHGGFTDPFIPMAMGPEDAAAMVGTLSSMAFAPDSQDQVVLDFLQGLGAVLGFPPGEGGVSGAYQGALLLITALTAANGDATPDTLIDAIFAADFVGPEGPESFAPGQQAATKNIYVVQVNTVPGMEGMFMYTTVETYENVAPTGLVP